MLGLYPDSDLILTDMTPPEHSHETSKLYYGFYPLLSGLVRVSSSSKMSQSNSATAQSTYCDKKQTYFALNSPLLS